MRQRSSARTALVTVFGLVALLPGVASAGKAPASGIKSYTASVATASAGGTADLSLTSCSPCGTKVSNNAFSSALVTSTDLSLAGLRVDHGWTAVPVSSTAVQLLAGPSGTPVVPGDTLHVTVPTPAPGTYHLGTQVKQSNDFSGTGNNFAAVDSSGTGTDGTVVLTVTGLPASVTWETQPSTVQGRDSRPVTTGVTAITTMCAAPSVTVRTSGDVLLAGVTVTLTASPSAGMLLGDSPVLAAVTDATGTATFGTCTSGLSANGLGALYTLTATAGTVRSLPSAPFSVLASYGTCSGACSGSTTGPNATRGDVTATGTGTARFTLLSDSSSSWDLTEFCDPDPDVAASNPYRDQVTVDITNRSKTVTLTWSKAAVQWATNNGTSHWQVCLAADYPFPRYVGTSRTLVTDGSAGFADGQYVGALLPCSDIRTAGYPCLVRLGRSAGQQVATVSLPLPASGSDPRMI